MASAASASAARPAAAAYSASASASASPGAPISTTGHDVCDPDPRSQTSPDPNMMPGSENDMRAYRACLHCRGRKTKCNLDQNNGQPPCKRCRREGRECILGSSNRGGRRVRKKVKLESVGFQDLGQPSLARPAELPKSDYSDSPVQGGYGERPSDTLPQDRFSQYERFNWQQSGASNTPEASYPRPPENSSPVPFGFQRRRDNSSPAPYNYAQQPYSPTGLNHPANSTRSSESNIASATLQNPSDAFDILLSVAHRHGEATSADVNENEVLPPINAKAQWKPISPPVREDQLFYTPSIDGKISPEAVYHLFSIYQKHYHPFFPIASRETFDRTRIPWLSKHEPHLFSAILTVASKDDEKAHEICYNHMQHLISMILLGDDAGIEAVEALLILSQWVSHRPKTEIKAGRGEEDRVAWMYSGTALRLGYLLDLDRTAFKSDITESTGTYNRKRLVWSFCYIADRAVAVSLGKGFWARGPGPLSGLSAQDFPTLLPTSIGEDNWAELLEANLGLTQIFSNVHDILYSSKGHGWKQMLEGRYAKYIDDFRTSARNWYDKWGRFNCSPKIKGILLLSYEYLRLYVNAFAYQATISRAMIYSKEANSQSVPLIDTTAPDARFIYEAIDAATSLLTTFIDLVPPETSRYMPSRNILIIVYSAVFLYKARATTTMSATERSGIRAMITQTIDLLQRSSAGANNMGSRYSRLLQLLWRRFPKEPAPRDILIQSVDARLQIPLPQSQQPTGDIFPSMGIAAMNGASRFSPLRGNSSFSWLDLPAAWTFATQNNSATGSGDDMDMLSDSTSVGLRQYGDMSMAIMSDYSLLNENNPNLLF